MRLKPIVVLFTGHCGSSWFVDVVGRQPWCVRLGFEPLEIVCRKAPEEQAARLIEAILSGDREIISGLKGAFEPVSPLGPETTHIVFKTRLHQDRPDIFEEVMPRSGAAFIHIRRKDKIAAAVSNFKRSVLSISHLKKDAPIDSKRKPVTVDVERIVTKARQFARRDTLLDEWKRRHAITCVDLWYEDLLQDFDAAVRPIEETFGFRISNSGSTYQKMTSSDLSQAVANYQELADRLSCESDATALRGNGDVVLPNPPRRKGGAGILSRLKARIGMSGRTAS